MADQFVQGDTATGPGEAPPLPEGAAAQLNAANAAAQTPAASEPQTPTAPPTAPTDQASPAAEDTAGPVALEPPYTPNGSTGLDPEAEKYLFSPTEYPSEPLHAGILQGGQIAPTKDAYDQLDALRMAAADPTAGPNTHLLASLLAQQLP